MYNTLDIVGESNVISNIKPAKRPPYGSFMLLLLSVASNQITYYTPPDISTNSKITYLESYSQEDTAVTITPKFFKRVRAKLGKITKLNLIPSNENERA